VAATDFAARELLPALLRCGLLPTEIASDRKVQEVVYLLKRAGFELGYRYKWELFGPYSAELADQIQDLDEESIERASPDDATASNDVVVLLNELTAQPQEIDLPDEDWLRLVTCIDFVEQRVPGATENGGTPEYIARNFEPRAIDAARERVRELLAA